MPYTSPAAQSSGAIAPATWAAAVKAGLDYLANPPACRVNGAAQTPATGAETALAFNAERYDTNTMHDTVTNNSRITFTTAGLYVVSGHIRFAAHATGIRQVGIRLNGATYIAVHLQPNAGGAVVVPMSLATTYKFAAGDYVQLVTYQDSGTSLAVEAVANMSPEFTATWVGLG